MKKDFRLNVFIFYIMVLILSATSLFADNPIIQTKYTADPAPMVWDDTLYLYTTHDEDNATGFTMYDWLLYSTTDMVNWTDHGVIAGVVAPHKTFAWSDGYNAWAAQCAPRNGKFYLYVPTPYQGKMVIGVAVADSPTGPFTDPIGRPLVIGPDSHDIDPSVFTDDDGQAYLYWGHQRLRYVKLNQDMVSYSGSIVELSRPQTYEEGPWLYKRNNNYYLGWASTCCPEGIGYAMSNSPMGPWTFRGSIMDGNPASDGNHPGIVDYKGNSYCFGLNYELLWITQSNKVERRSVAVEKITYNADGTIQKLPFWSDTGVSQIGTLNPYDQTEAETICWAWQVKTEECNEGGMDVCNIENGDYIKVKGVDFGNGATSFDARVASAASGGTIEILLDSTTGTLVGSCSVPGTGGWQNWMTVTCDITGATGIHDLYFRFTGGSGSLFTFNWWKFYGGAESTPTPVPTEAPTQVPGTISLACGSSSDVGTFLPDQYFSGGSTYNNSNTVDVSQITEDTPPAALFNNERYGEMSYTIPGFTSGNSYIVTLYFAETYLTASGGRLFDVSINGDTVLSSFDIYASAGGQDIAIARSFTTTGNASGQIIIQFISGTENPKINGISIRPGEGPTTPPTPTPTTTPGDCNVFFNPNNSTQGINSTFEIDVVVDSGNQELAAYGFNITYDPIILSVVDVEEGSDGFLSAANTQTPGEIVVSGFDTSGTGPDSDLQVLIITFTALEGGASVLGLNVDQLVDGETNTIGTACGNDGSVEIMNITLGDADGDGDIDIVDALLIAQYYVELDPSPFIPGNADTDCDGDIDIVDALLVAQYYVMLISEFC
jgi:arabinoxylan arabinofuranohydrolase